MSILWKATIKGNPTSKSNSSQIFRNKFSGKTFLSKSERSRSYIEQFLAEVYAKKLAPKTPIECDIALHCWIFYDSRRPDLDDSQICDNLEKAGIIKNDRQIKEKHLYHNIDRDNPRAVIILKKL